jgi:hypothetical protein
MVPVPIPARLKLPLTLIVVIVLAGCMGDHGPRHETHSLVVAFHDDGLFMRLPGPDRWDADPSALGPATTEVFWNSTQARYRSFTFTNETFQAAFRWENNSTVFSAGPYEDWYLASTIVWEEGYEPVFTWGEGEPEEFLRVFFPDADGPEIARMASAILRNETVRTNATPTLEPFFVLLRSGDETAEPSRYTRGARVRHLSDPTSVPFAEWDAEVFFPYREASFGNATLEANADGAAILRAKAIAARGAPIPPASEELLRTEAVTLLDQFDVQGVDVRGQPLDVRSGPY